MLACPCTIARSLNGAAAITAECLLSDNTEDGPEAACQLAGKGAANAAIEISSRTARVGGTVPQTALIHVMTGRYSSVPLNFTHIRQKKANTT